MKTIAALLLFVGIIEASDVLKFQPRDEVPSWCKGLDCPAFKVLEKTAAYELREYSASNWVSTDLVGIDYSKASRPMFMKLFNYIQGTNVKEEKIDMTVPVRTRINPAQGPACEDNFTMSFFLAPKVADPPKPTDGTVRLSTLPDKFTVYVSEFGGYMWDIDDWIKKAVELSEALEKDGKKYETSYYYINGYDSPWTFFNRHNEIWFLKK